MQTPAFYQSLKNHQIKCQGTSWFSLPVTLTGGDNPYLQYPVDGVIRFAEQGTDLHASKTIFHRSNPDGSLGAPVSVANATFEYRGRQGAALDELTRLGEEIGGSDDPDDNPLIRRADGVKRALRADERITG